MTRALLLFLVLSAGSAAAQCRPSASGERSLRVTLSPVAGGACVHDVNVYRGRDCGGDPLWSAAFGCSETRRMIVTDEGTLVTLLALRASRRDYEIVRVFERDGDALSVRSVRLGELPARDRTVRLRLDAHRLTILESPGVTVPVATLTSLGRIRARRSLRWR